MGYYNKELDEINFKIIETCEQLKPYIYSYWVVKKDKIDTPMTQKILSDGCMGITINFKSAYAIKVNGNTQNCIKNFIIDGPTKHPSYMLLEKELYLLGIRFKPAGAYVFFDENIDTFENKHITLKNNSTWQIDILYKKLITTENLEDKIKLLEDFFMQKLKSNKKRS